MSKYRSPCLKEVVCQWCISFEVDVVQWARQTSLKYWIHAVTMATVKVFTSFTWFPSDLKIVTFLCFNFENWLYFNSLCANRFQVLMYAFVWDVTCKWSIWGHLSCLLGDWTRQYVYTLIHPRSSSVLYLHSIISTLDLYLCSGPACTKLS